MQEFETGRYDPALKLTQRAVSEVRLTAVFLLAGIGLALYQDPIWPWTVPAFTLAWATLGTLMWSPKPSSFERRRASRLQLMAEAARVGRRADSLRWDQPVWRFPDREAYLVFTFLGLSLFGLRAVLGRLDASSGLGPADAPAIVSTAVGIPALIAVVIAVIPRTIRAWGAKAKDTGMGGGAQATGRADIIRAEKEGEAAVIRANAELVRAQAELKRAELGLEPLPAAPTVPEPGTPTALPSTTNNGNGPAACESAGGNSAA
ncbi:hypothetical protein ACIP10_07140 [Streptomyces galbus]|uniref:hypothetical protein n=1 Tax=Streptomyces galbus TaxID=33898 RepID=UPI0037A1D3D0